MASIEIYMIFNGQAEEASKFYCDIFGGEVQFLQRYSEGPQESPAPKEWGDKILHMVFKVRGAQIMASDSYPGNEVNSGNQLQVSVNFRKEEDITPYFEKLSSGGKTTMPLQETFWGARFGMLVDRYGVSWMFNQDLTGKES